MYLRINYEFKRNIFNLFCNFVGCLAEKNELQYWWILKFKGGIPYVIKTSL